MVQFWAACKPYEYYSCGSSALFCTCNSQFDEKFFAQPNSATPTKPHPIAGLGNLSLGFASSLFLLEELSVHSTLGYLNEAAGIKT
jgi:hypothetical protein